MTNLGAIFSAVFQSLLDPFRRKENRGFDTFQRPMIAICVGHSRSGDRGAKSIGGVYEWDFLQPLAYDLKQELARRGIDSRVIDVYDGSGYAAAMTWLGRHLVDIKPKAAVELHFNSAGPTAHGYEHLFWKRSTSGERFATSLNVAHGDRFPTARNRGIKGLGLRDRGGLFLRVTPCPACIIEPFFGSNGDEWREYSARAQDLVESWAAGIAHYLGIES